MTKYIYKDRKIILSQIFTPTPRLVKAVADAKERIRKIAYGSKLKVVRDEKR